MPCMAGEFKRVMVEHRYSDDGIDSLFDYYDDDFTINVEDIVSVWTEYSKEGLTAAFDGEYKEFLRVNRLLPADLSLVDYVQGFAEVIKTKIGSFLVKQVC